MRRRAPRRSGQTANADRWYGTSWCCECEYTNVGSERCYFCGSLAPRHLRDQLARVPAAEPAPAGGEG